MYAGTVRATFDRLSSPRGDGFPGSGDGLDQMIGMGRSMNGTGCSWTGHAGRPTIGAALTLAAALALNSPPAVRQARAQQPPSPAEHLGYAAGARFTDVAAVGSYAEALAAASPSVRIERYGETPEGRPLLLLIVGREEALRDLSDLERLRELTDPNRSAARARELASTSRAVVWFTYGIHGDESSSTEAALWTAWDLAVGTDGVGAVLDSLVVVIDPVANPDGRDRYVNWYRSVRGVEPNPEVSSTEHSQPWPGGRYNHYLFDLNRDWTWATQPETRARLEQFARWRPAVHVDFHEMGHESSYFFFPAAAPVNPIYPESTTRWAEYFGRENARVFDQRRWLYYTAEQFDLFYPGYGDSWPSLVGAIGMTYEQAGGGRAGLVVRRSDDDLLTLSDRLERHRVAGLSTLRAAAARKTELLLDFGRFHSDPGIEDADVLLVPAAGTAIHGLSSTLLAQGIQVERAVQPFRAGTAPHPGFTARSEFPEGTLRVRAGQPRGRLALTLLQPDVPHPDSGPGRTYDITAWSLPYAFGVEAHTVTGALRDASFTPLVTPQESKLQRAPPSSERPLGWLVAPTWDAAGPVIEWLRRGGKARALHEGFELEGKRWPAGTLFVQADTAAIERLLTAGLEAHAIPVNTGWTGEGPDLGTSRSSTLRAPRIGVFRGEGVWPTSFGAAWYFLERTAGIPFDALDLHGLSRLELDRWDVLVVPDGSPGRILDEADAQTLRGWLEGGGTLVAFASSARWAGREIAGIEARSFEPDSLSDDDRRLAALRTREQRREDYWDRSVNGIVLPVRADDAHPLAAGAGLGNADRRQFVLHLDDVVFEPSDGFESVLAFEKGVRAVSGVVSESKLEDLGASAWLAAANVGRGKLVLFADDPLFRLMWPSQFVLFTNALLLGPNM